MSKYRGLGIEYLKGFAIGWKYYLMSIPKILFLIILALGLIIALFQIVDGRNALQIWNKSKLDRTVYTLCNSRSENRVKGAFVVIGATYPESEAEERTKQVINNFNDGVREYKEKRKSGEITKRSYFKEKEASAYWAENPNGDYGILINWEDTEFPDGYTVESVIIQGK